MSSILFLIEVIAFVVVAYWAYNNDRPGADAAHKGLLKMREPVVQAAAAAVRRIPSWKKQRGVDKTELVDDPILRSTQPKWKRSLRQRG